MSAAKHTPGPWCVAIEDNTPVIKNADGFHITHTIDDAGYESTGKTMFDNARLIAAAPELLEALEDLVNNGIGTQAVNRARAAIAKARSV